MSVNPCARVRQSCLQYVKSVDCKSYVTIDREKLEPLAQQVVQAAQIQWDEDGWHYGSGQLPPHWSIRNERIASYILALDAINFCFWPSENHYEYEDLATTLQKAALADRAAQEQTPDTLSPRFAFSSSNLQNMTAASMRSLFELHHAKQWVPPDVEQRCRLWNEVGRSLEERFDGSVQNLIQSAHGSAPRLVAIILDAFPGFRDHSDGVLYFYKRAQICVGDWNAALNLNLTDMDQLTTFADYRVPQLLRHFGVLQYSKELEASVDAKQELSVNSRAEWAIRSCTVAAVEYLVDKLKKQGASYNAVTTDWYLWQVGERMEVAGQLKPHHRVRTIFY